MSETSVLCDIGFVGAGVMGKNLILNLADHGYRVAAFDLDHKKLEAVIAQDKAERGDKPARVICCSSYTELLSRLSSPHLVIVSVPAGKPVDDVCLKLIDAGIQADDIIVDTGNSLWTDTVRREKHYEGKFIFFSTAVSGGEVGARFGPSLMPSGDPYAWTRIEPIWRAIAAKVDPATGRPLERHEPGNPVIEGEPCATYIGPGGSGHYVKMVHNGIEYADMQLICEVYQVMRDALGMSAQQVSDVFKEWNQGILNSYLMEISAEVLATKDSETGLPLVDVILDKAGQKGTGLWTAVSSLELGCPAPTISEAVFARSMSTLKDQRVLASTLLSGPVREHCTNQTSEQMIKQLHDALYCAKICVYAQGFDLMKTAAAEHGWQLNFAEIAKIWRAGCIIRAVFLQSITEAYERNDDLQNLLLDPFFSKQISVNQMNWRRAVAEAAMTGIPVSALSSALSYYDSYRTAVLPANLLQGQRDYFGAHTFERTDKAKGKTFHVDWSHNDRPMQKIK
ncbi:NADP-dependent phosphogluconate dehydrogenase [Rheinheimera sp. MM224]|uniref:NADP-dependent phosphogluconate dehydrogenase n=1 Tax=Rheinheimera sp. MM224 TaxID=3019969 RepID=UPI0021F8F63E|nr:NADP-dependent phosphogluconate dehydrogenase [Rheinheimera sp. MM224]CAI3798841.1 6-phosphogluconate dehydrogenase, NADP(+)-dependent, decarboxylating [Rheinheimera sp. MM224]